MSARNQRYMSDREMRAAIAQWERERVWERERSRRARGEIAFAIGMAWWVLMLLFPLVPFTFAVVGAAVVGLCSWMWCIA